jgi:hypothetical protein
MGDVEALSTIVGVLKELEPDVQKRVLQSVHAFLDIPIQQKAVHQSDIALNVAKGASGDEFSRDRTISPKEFLRDKNPVTDVERVTCIAYYLTHYRDTPHFKTLDISALNTEAAQPKFSNASVAVDNSRALGYLVPASRGNKQISAAGERFVELLPDRDAARDSFRNYRPKKRSARKAKVLGRSGRN